MNAAEEKILSMVAAKQISPAEAEILLDAVRQKPRPWFMMLLNPFERLGLGSSMVLALLVEAACLALGRLGVRFDGTIDVHLGSGPVPITKSLVELVVSWPLFAGVLYAVAKINKSHGRFLDFLGSTGVARGPLLLVGLLAPFAAQSRGGGDSVLLVVALVAVLAAVWTCTLLYYATKTNSGLAGARLAISVIGGVLIAEVVAKVVLALAV